MPTMLDPSPFYKPFRYAWAFDRFSVHEDLHWTTKEAPIGDDVKDWKSGRLSDAEKNLITATLRLFTHQDKTVAEFYTDVLIPVFKNNEIRTMFRGFNNREDVHQAAYDLVNATLGLPDEEHEAFLQYKEMVEKAEFAKSADTRTPTGIALALTRGVLNEGLSLFGSFAPLLSFEMRGLMLGMCKVVSWSVRDEDQHVEGLAQVFHTFCAEHPEVVTDAFKKRVYDDFREAVRLEDQFIDLIFGMGPLANLTADTTKEYIRFLADRRLKQIGFKPNWNVEQNPLPWVDFIVSGEDHSNFFETKSSEYAQGSLVGSYDYGKMPESVLIYTREGCPFCVKAKDLLERDEIPYRVVSLTDYEKRQRFFEIEEFEGNDRTLPKIYNLLELRDEDGVDPKLIGGYAELKQLLMTAV